MIRSPTAPTAPVPACYVGLWQRTLLRTPNVRDTSTRVFWLQTQTWHADIRIPADRPELAGCNGFADLSGDALRALSRQQGFAGITEVHGDVCRWHRQMDFQPQGKFNDIGLMQFDSSQRVLEYGIEQEYFEVWERVPESIGETWCEQAHAGAVRTLLLAAGEWFMFVRPRAIALPKETQLDSLIASAGSESERWQLLDFEISLGRRGSNGAAWRIELSTLPWREGRFAPAALATQGFGLCPRG